MHTHAYTVSHTHTHSFTHTVSHTHTLTMMSWCPQWDSAPRAGLGGLGVGGRGVEAALPRSGADTGLAVSPGQACGRVWKQRAQPQARVFRQSVLSLMLRLVPHCKQQQAAPILSLVQKCRHSGQSRCRCLQGSCVTDPWCQPGYGAGESHSPGGEYHHWVSSTHPYLSPTLETAYMILGSFQHE